jgi:molybdate transport system substrate-binding protein
VFSVRCRLAIVVFGLFALQTGFAQQAKTLRIAAAADLQPVLPALLAEFHSQTGVNVEASYASSSTLATQIINGGPFDLFLAADLSFPQKVIDASLGDSASPIPYARGTLVLWTRNDSPVHDLSVETLRDPSLGKVAVADAAHAPYGRAAKAAIENLGLTDALKDKLVVAENIAQTAQFVESGNAEVGLISLTSAVTPRLKAVGKYVEVPASAYPPIVQGAVVIKNSPDRDDAHRFLDFMNSAPVREQLSARGLQAP